MSNLDSLETDIDEMLKPSSTYPDFVIDGVHLGRGDAYYNKDTSTQLKHTTIQLKCWRIVNENLEELEDKLMNNFYNSETYIIQWDLITENFQFNTNEILSKSNKRIYFYWKGEAATKGYSPLPKAIEKDNPPVERTTQWAEPPVFLQLFHGAFVVHNGTHNTLNDEPHLYILRGEMQNELHLYEVPLKKESLRSRTSFVLNHPKEKSTIIWHGSKSNSRCKNAAKQVTNEIFGAKFSETTEGSESEKFLKSFPKDGGEYFVNPSEKVIDYTPRLFYLNKITGDFMATEVECCLKSAYFTPFPFMQTHLYSTDQPATFLFDDHDEIWLWQGWQRDEDTHFKSECFTTTINYAKQKSKLIKKLVKVQKVLAGFEPLSFTNLFPVWKTREDIAQLQMKEGISPNTNPLIEVTHDESAQ